MRNIYYLLFLLPFPLYAQTTGSIQEFFVELSPILRGFFTLSFSVAILVFFWGIAKFILHSGNEEEVAKGKRFLIWGVVALFVMFSIVGIIAVLQDILLGGAPSGGYVIPTNPNP